MQIHYPLNPATGLEDSGQLPWTNGSPASGVEGSYPGFGLFTDAQSEIIAAIQEAGITPSGADLAQLLRAIRGGKLTTFTDTGAANHIVITPMTAHTAIAEGLPFRIFPANTNTLSAVDVKVGTLAAAPLIKNDGSLPTPGDIVAGRPIDIVDHGGNFRIMGLSPSDGLRTAGQCRLGVNAPTSIELLPYQGNVTTINGQNQVVPSGGVFLLNSGLSASTVYNIYVFMSAGVMTLEASTTAHATDAITGQEIKSGDATRTLVGKVLTDASIHFNDNASLRGCINWFNRRPLSITSGPSTNSTSSATNIELGSAMRATFLSWGIEAVFAVVTAFAFNTSALAGGSLGIMLDGTFGVGANSGFVSPSASATEAVVSSISFVPSEGSHVFSVGGSAAGGGGMTATMAIQTTIQG